jgi:hypothetical protein
MSLREQIFSTYLDAQRGLTEVSEVDDRNVLLSLPLHFSANQRVELVVTQITESYYAISDMAQTIGELKDAGYGINPRLKEKIENIAKLAGVHFEGNHLMKKCSASELGESIHQFAEVAKTIGDAYLTYRMRKPKELEDELIAKVRRIFEKEHYAVAEKQEVKGRIEKHTIDFYIPPNGTRGLALAVLTNPSHIIAEAWGFKTQDIKYANQNLAVSLVYDSSRARDESTTILNNVADYPIPSSSINEMGDILKKAGIPAAGSKR